MKFISARFWKERGECCIFFEVLNVVSDENDTAILEVAWCRQSDRGWKQFGSETMKVMPRNYNRIYTYQPRGDNLNVLH